MTKGTIWWVIGVVVLILAGLYIGGLIADDFKNIVKDETDATIIFRYSGSSPTTEQCELGAEGAGFVDTSTFKVSNCRFDDSVNVCVCSMEFK